MTIADRECHLSWSFYPKILAVTGDHLEGVNGHLSPSELDAHGVFPSISRPPRD